MLIRCQNSLRCSMTDIHQSLIQSEDENNSRFSGRYFAYSTLSSVNMPCTPSAHPEPHLSNRLTMCALSRPSPPSTRLMISSK